MELEGRLEKLRLTVVLEKDKSPITFWPENIKMESVELSNLLGAEKVAKVTELNKSTILYWAKKFKNKGSFLSSDQSSISITRIVSSETKAPALKSESYPVAVLNLGNTDFKIYCVELAEKIAVKFFR